MDTGQLGTFLSSDHLPLLLSAVAILLALGTILFTASARRRHREELTTLRERADTLWREVDEFRVAQFNHAGEPGSSPQMSTSFDDARYRTEKEAYDNSGHRCGTCTSAWACSSGPLKPVRHRGN